MIKINIGDENSSSKKETKKETKKEEKIYFTGDKLLFCEDKKIFIGEGNICIVQKENILKADMVKYDQINKMIYVEGSVEYKDKEKMFLGEYFKYDTFKEQGICPHGSLTIKPFYCKGSPIERLDKNRIYIEEGLFTTCDKSSPHYWFKGKKIMLFPKDKVIAKGIRIYILGLPVPPIFNWPFYMKSLKKKPTGFEFNYGYEKYKGLYFRNEYKYNFKDFLYGSAWLEFTSEMDICLGGKEEADYKFKLKKGGKVFTSANGSFTGLYNEKGEKDSFTNEIKKSKRWNINWHHQQNLPFNIDNNCLVELASQKRYTQAQVETYEELLKNELISSIYFRKNFKMQNIDLHIKRRFDIKNEKEEISLPKISYFKGTSPLLPFNKIWKISLPKVSYSLETDFINYSLKDFKQPKINYDGMGVDTELTLKMPVSLFNWINITPETKIEEVYYNKSKENNQPVWFYKIRNSVGINTTFYRIFKIQIFNFIKGMRHSISPSVAYYYKQTTDFRDNNPVLNSLPDISRFESGHPIKERVDFTLNSDLQVKQQKIEIDEKGEELKRDWSKRLEFMKSVNTLSYNFDYITGTYEPSPLYSSLRIKPFDMKRKSVSGNLLKETIAYMNFGINTTYNFETQIFEKNNFDLSYNYYKNIYKKREIEEKFSSSTENLWFNLNTSLIFNRRFLKDTYEDSLRIYPLRIGFNVFEGWKLNYATFIDFTHKEEIFRSHEFELNKSLHCWELKVKLSTFEDRVNIYCSLGIKEFMPGAMIQWNEEIIKK